MSDSSTPLNMLIYNNRYFSARLRSLIYIYATNVQHISIIYVSSGVPYVVRGIRSNAPTCISFANYLFLQWERFLK